VTRQDLIEICMSLWRRPSTIKQHCEFFRTRAFSQSDLDQYGKSLQAQVADDRKIVTGAVKDFLAPRGRSALDRKIAREMAGLLVGDMKERHGMRVPRQAIEDIMDRLWRLPS